MPSALTLAISLLRRIWRTVYPLAPLTPQEGLAEEGDALDAFARASMRRTDRGPSHLSALCLSGGGIRSATFCLGVLEGLGRLGLLHRFDYLSTVSGGGYIGSWLTAWCDRARDGLRGVLKEFGDADGQPWPVHYLSANREYLSPVVGGSMAMSVAAAFLFRAAMTWFVLLPALMAPLALMFLADAVPTLDLLNTKTGTCTILLLWLLSVLPWLFLCSRIVSHRAEHGTRARFLRLFLLPLTAWALLSSVLIGNGSMTPRGAGTIVAAAGFFAAVFVPVVWAPAMRVPVSWLHKLGAALLIFIAALFEASVITLVPVEYYRRLGEINASASACLLLLFQWIAGTFVRLVASMPWWSRARSWLLGAGFALVVARGLLDLAAASFWTPTLVGAVEAVGLIAGVVCLIYGFKSAAEAVSRRKARPGVRGLVVGLCALVASSVLMLDQAWLAQGVLAQFRWVPYLREHAPWLAPIALCAVPYLLGFVVDLNRISLHPLYRDGLVAAFLGASRRDRSPDPLTGLDSGDDLELPPGPGNGPYHVLCAAVRTGAETSVAGHRLTESFTFTPHAAGSIPTGYRSSRAFYGGTTLGTAMAVSGAAVSPNIVRRSGLATELLRTMLNVHLGIWVGNPRSRFAWRFRRPLHPLHVLLPEITGSSSLRSSYVYVTDGGHFENLGLYEMVRRQCEAIVVIDASYDPALTFEDLANACARIRVDFNTFVDVDIKGFAAAKSVPGVRWARGTVRYPSMSRRPGDIVYIKPVVLGDEGLEVTNYHQLNPEFPHDTTTDQFYSEAQFDAYRALGELSVLTAGDELIRLLDPERRANGMSL